MGAISEVRARRFRLRGFFAFTLAELLVVIAVLAILSAIGFLSFSGYRQDARDAATKANVRTIYSAIVAESASKGNSPRYYVNHDPNYALSGGVVVFDGVSNSLAGGDWDAPNTNYSAGNPNYVQLRLNPDKFRTASLEYGFHPFSNALAATADPSLLLVGATSVTQAVGGKPRLRTYAQVAGILSTNVATVTGDYLATSGSVGGLVKDVSNPSSTGALVDSATVGSTPGCAATTASGYSVPALPSGQSASVSKIIANGTVSATASCLFGTVSILSEAASCSGGYVPSSGPSCVADACGGTVPANASSTATSQSVGSNWQYSATPGQCTFACSAGFTWDGSTCRASCTVPVSDTYSGQTYSVTPNGALPHAGNLSTSASASFGASPANGTLFATFSYSCADGVLSKAVTPGSGTCQSNYAWNSNWTAPVCTGAAQTVTFNGNGGSGHSPASLSVSYNSAVGTLPSNPTRAGYSFNGWFTAASGGTQITSATVVTANATWYAQWTLLTYAVSGSFGAYANGASVSVCGSNATADASGNFSVSGIPYGTACNNATATRSGYVCTISANGPASLSGNFTTVSGSCTGGFITAVGGTVTTSGNYKIHTFTNVGSSTFQVTSAPVGATVSVLVVAGGGGGGGGDFGANDDQSGGGGAGGYCEQTNRAVTAASYGVTVGAGGTAGGWDYVNATRGGNSLFDTVTAHGGGAGQNFYSPSLVNGGSGGGGAGWEGSYVAGGISTQANSGGATCYGNAGYSAYAGGGGGAGGAGTGDAGGPGRYSTISGTNKAYAGGGAPGGVSGMYGGNGGVGGGGSAILYASTPGAANTGGGGAGGGYDFGDPTAGGSGIVIVRYLYQ